MKNKVSALLGMGERIEGGVPAGMSPLLFKPALAYRLEMLGKLEIEEAFLAGDGLAADKLSTKSAALLKTGSGGDTPAKFIRTSGAETVFCLWPDTPLMEAGYGREALEAHQRGKHTATMLIANSGSRVLGFIFAAGILLDYLEEGGTFEKAALEELYQSFRGDGPSLYRCPDPLAALDITVGQEYLEAQNRLKARVLERLMEAGVLILSTDGVLIHPDAEIGSGTIIYPGTVIREGTKIGTNCILGPNTLIDSCTLGDGCVINASQMYSSETEDDVQIGPYSHIRPNTLLKRGVRLGDFVEVKNSVIGEDSHVSHLTYVGDSDVGGNVNFGCGVVTVNYDGTNKNRCVVRDNAFIGCNTNLVAPVEIGDGAYTAAGSTITDDVPEDSLAIARARQVNKEGYAKGRFAKAKK